MPSAQREEVETVAMLTFLVDINPNVCLQLVAEAPLGRLGVVSNGRPEIYPVNHVYDAESGSIMFPTDEGTKLHSALDWPWVAFEVDGMDAEADSGWSVLVVGRAEVVTDAAAIARATVARNARWRSGPDVVWLRVVPTTISGRRITASDEGITIKLDPS